MSLTESKTKTSPSKTSPLRLKKVLWPVDVFSESPQAWQKSQIELLKLLGATRKLEIEPIYILSPDGMNLPFAFAPHWAKKYKVAAESSFGSLLKGLDIPGVKPPRVLIQTKPSRHQSIRNFLDYAKRAKADLICLSTHARSGLPRLLLGSFAETLMLKSDIPLLIAQPASAIAPLKHILFPTDLGKDTEAAFRQAVALAKESGAELRLLHVVTDPVESVVQSGVYLFSGGWVSFEAYRERELADKERKLGLWREVAARLGVRCESKVVSADGRVAETILKEARKEHCQMIAMAAQSGTVASTLVGSVARQVVRESDLPVWIVRAR